MRPVDPTIPFPLSALLNDIRAGVVELQTPTQPVRMATVDFAGLPLAADWPACMIHVSDRNCIAISTPVAGVYTWLRADGGAL